MAKSVSAESGFGILGGTFDPVHAGHLAVAERVRGRLGLACVYLLPNAVPPHRAQPHASPAQRLAMLRLATRDIPGLCVDDRELHRAGPSWTVDTLVELRAEHGPRQRIVLILGADAFADLHNWSRWLQVFDLAQIAVVARSETGLEAPSGMPAEVVWNPDGRPLGQAARAVTVIADTVSSLASSVLRAQLPTAAFDQPPTGLPPAVFEYICGARLYGTRCA